MKHGNTKVYIKGDPCASEISPTTEAQQQTPMCQFGSVSAESSKIRHLKERHLKILKLQNQYLKYKSALFSWWCLQPKRDRSVIDQSHFHISTKRTGLKLHP